MTKRSATDVANELNKGMLAQSLLEARIQKPTIGNPRGTGYAVAVYHEQKVVIPAQGEKRELVRLARAAAGKSR